MTDAVPLREYIEGIFEEQRRGLLVAEEEREKAAKALRAELARAIDEGDDRLREHIDQQFKQINAALESAEKLEIERIAKVSSDIKSVAREIRIAADASSAAIIKAEVATDKRLEGLNELRHVVSDAQAHFLPREVAEAQFTELRRAISEISDKINKLV